MRRKTVIYMVTINFYVGHNALATLTRHRCRFLAMCLSCPCDCKKLAYFPYSSTPPSSETVHSSTILEYWIPQFSSCPSSMLLRLLAETMLPKYSNYSTPLIFYPIPQTENFGFAGIYLQSDSACLLLQIQSR